MACWKLLHLVWWFHISPSIPLSFGDFPLVSHMTHMTHMFSWFSLTTSIFFTGMSQSCQPISAGQQPFINFWTQLPTEDSFTDSKSIPGAWLWSMLLPCFSLKRAMLPMESKTKIQTTTNQPCSFFVPLGGHGEIGSIMDSPYKYSMGSPVLGGSNHQQWGLL